MEQIQGRFYLNYTDNVINDIIRTNSDTAEHRPYTLHYNQNEEFFIRSEEEFTIPSFPVHHDVKLKTPNPEYLEILRECIKLLVPVFPQVFSGLTYFFDPAENLRPCFYQLFKIRETHFLYLLRLDFHFKPNDSEIISQGTNDSTTSFRTRNFFLEGDIIPLEKVLIENGRVVAFLIKQTVSQTWIGETGRGYFVQGIWMDAELTKFFSKLFLPERKQIYPYYPFMCKFRTITYTLIDLSFPGRKKYLPHLVQAMDFVKPQMERIQESLRKIEFTPELPIFQEMKRQVPEKWNGAWDNLQINRYLNEKDMKEFTLELQP